MLFLSPDFLFSRPALLHANDFFLTPFDRAALSRQAAEALGAIGADGSVAALERYVSDPAPEVSQVRNLNIGVWKAAQAKRQGSRDVPRPPTRV